MVRPNELARTVVRCLRCCGLLVNNIVALLIPLTTDLHGAAVAGIVVASFIGG